MYLYSYRLFHAGGTGGTMEIVNKRISELRPYKRNPRNNDDAVDLVAASIREFGFKVPIIIDRDGEIVAGHTRLKAAKKLQLKEVPCIVADDLSPEQIKAFRLADNKVSEAAEWDYELLSAELDEILTFDMTDFGFDIDEVDDFADRAEAEHQQNKEDTQFTKSNILNLEYAQFAGSGKYDIPIIRPVYELPEIREWISFNYVLSDTDPEGKAVHFFVDDYQFERVWNNPDAYLDKLRQYVCVASPDFSPYGDMPLALQIYNHYRKHWCAAYWQLHGITVIPTIRGSTDERSKEWWLDGEPKGGIILVSEMWSAKQNDAESSKKANDEITEKLDPCKWFVYGHGNREIYDGMNAEFISTYTEKRW